MNPAPLEVISTPEQAWNLMSDDFVLRNTRMTIGMTEQFQEDIEKIESELRRTGRSGTGLQKCIELELKHTDDDAGKLYQACCDVWETQGRQRCRAFFQAIADYCLYPMFKKRRAAVIRRLKRIDGSEQRDDFVCQFVNHSRALQAEWDIRLEIESRNREYFERRQNETLECSALAGTPQTAPETPAGKSISKAKTKPLPAAERKKRSVIFGAIQIDLRAQEYCGLLDKRHLTVPQAWRDLGCPQNYPDAYKDRKWRKRIHDEKHRYKKKYDQTSASEREKLIQQEPHSSPPVSDDQK
jgi:hypothetical protein